MHGTSREKHQLCALIDCENSLARSLAHKKHERTSIYILTYVCLFIAAFLLFLRATSSSAIRASALQIQTHTSTCKLRYLLRCQVVSNRTCAATVSATVAL